ncbi:hypothetical protein BH11ARM2_BH11ARM2_13720 [soil metagenome]
MSKWPLMPLGKVTTIYGGSTPDSSNPDYWTEADDGIVWVTPTDLGQMAGAVVSGSARKITENGYASCGTEMLSAGAVIMSSRAPIGHLAIADRMDCTNQGCKSYVPGPCLTSEYLYWCLTWSKGQIKALGSGSTFTEVSKGALARFEIPVPPLNEQRQIVARLERQLAAIAATRLIFNAQSREAQDVRRSCVEQALTRGTESAAPLLVLLSTPLATGVSKPGDPTSPYHVLSLSAVREGNLDFSSVKSIGIDQREAFANKLEPRSFYIVRGNGNLNLVGRGAATADSVPENLVYPDLLIRAKPDEALISLDDLRIVWNTKVIRGKFRRRRERRQVSTRSTRQD